MKIFSRRGLHPQPYKILSLQVLFWRIPRKRSRFIRRKYFLFWVFYYTLSLAHFPRSFHFSFPLLLVAVVSVLSLLFHPVSLEGERRDSFQRTWQTMRS